MSQELVQDVSQEELKQLMDEEQADSPKQDATEQEAEKNEVETKPEEEQQVQEPQKEAEKPKELELVENLKSALRENREKMKILERKVEIANALKAEFDEFRKKKEPEVKVPVYEEDPLGHNKHEIEDLKRARLEDAEKLKRIEHQSRIQQMESYAMSLEADFKRATPDYQEAFDHLLGVQKNQLKIMGIPEESIPEALALQVKTFALNMIQNGQNPAKMAYELAKTYGYKAKAPEKTEVEKAVEKMAVVQQGMEKAAKTISRGGKVETPPSAEKLLEIKDPEEFNKEWKRIFEP